MAGLSHVHCRHTVRDMIGKTQRLTFLHLCQSLQWNLIRVPHTNNKCDKINIVCMLMLEKVGPMNEG